jgi:ATP-dependent helicase Lhr and Lhr-like helicase
MSGMFGRLSPFIQDYIYTHRWDELREIQVEACKVIFDTNHHLLLASGTASGKTEAAFLPVITDITNNPSSSIAVLYIAPIKALINDQFIRLNDLLTEADIPVWHWHGDVSPTHKKRMLNNPSGILQITPESMENMLLNKGNELLRLFHDLRYVIIDEVHNFMGSDRGMQILCQLERLYWHTRVRPRRIGLSATLGDYSLAEKWLASGTNIAVSTPVVNMGNKNIKLAVEHFYDSKNEDKNEDNNEGNKEDNNEDKKEEDKKDSESDESDTTNKASAFWEYLYERTLNKKCIVFTNLRNDAEMVIAMLRQIADLRGQPDVYHVHHGSISAALRESAETDMKESTGPVVIAATLTLEMGIDVGRLESIFQINAPNSVSSFLQRLGRSGRRGNAAEMWFLCSEQIPSGVPLPPQQLPWRLLQTIAVLQLYIEERWVESPNIIKYPLSLLYHQTMSIVASYGEITPEALAGKVLGMEPFSYITQEDYHLLLSHLLEIGHLQHIEDGGLIIGLEGEKLTNSFKFLAVFADDENEYIIIADSRPIGKIENPPPPGERVTLAGRTWEITEVDVKRKTVFVTRVRGKVQTYWKGGGNNINDRILEKMRDILICQTQYPYLLKNSRARLSEARFLCSHSGLADFNMISLGGKTVCILPWVGSVDFYTILYLMRKYMGDIIDTRSVGGWTPYYITAKLKSGTVWDLLADFQALLMQPLQILEDITDKDLEDLKGNYEYKPPKYDAFVPKELKKKAVVMDFINLDRLAKRVEAWKCGSLSVNEVKKDG